MFAIQSTHGQYFCYSSPNVLLPSDTQLPKSSYTSPNISSYYVLFLLYPS